MPVQIPDRTSSSDRVIYYNRVESPIGPLLLTSDGVSLTGLYMSDVSEARDEQSPGDLGSVFGVSSISGTWVADGEVGPLREARQQLAAYFEGKLTRFELPLSMAGTDFQRRVWDALTAIPFGVTISYGELAQSVGNPKGSRAVGLANGSNPISIIVPCHRVIGSNGKLTGYGGGLPRKAALLDFEFSVMLNGPRSFPRMDD